MAHNNPIHRDLSSAVASVCQEEPISVYSVKDGTDHCKGFQEQLLADISNHFVENFVHSRILSAMTEIRAILRYFFDGHTIALVPCHI